MPPDPGFEQGDGGRPIQVAYARDANEARIIKGLLQSAGIESMVQRAGISGLQVGTGLANTGGHGSRVIVRADRADEARTLLGDTLSRPEAFPEPVNAKHLADSRGRGPRSYGISGAYTRIYLSALAFFAIAFLLFLLLRAL
jgi:hypothetical protein